MKVQRILAGLFFSIALQAAQTATPTSSAEGAEQEYRRAIELESSGQSARAEALFRAACLAAPDEEKYLRALVNFYIQGDQFDRALLIIRHHVARNGATALGYALQGELLFKQKLYGPAYESLRQAIALSQADDYRVHELLGLIYIVYGRDYNAVEELQLATKQNPKSPQTRFWLGRMLYRTGRYADARTEFEECLRLDSLYPKVLENLALCHEALQDDVRAISLYEKAIELDRRGETPPAEDAYVDYALLLAKRSENARAESFLREGVKRNPDSTRASFELGRLLFQTGRIREAEAPIRHAIALDPNFSRPHYFLARICKSMHRNGESTAEYARFQELDRTRANREPNLTGNRGKHN